MDIGNLSHCDMHKPHECAHALTHSQAILAALSQSFVRTVGNAATWNWVLYTSCAIPSMGKQAKQLRFRYLTLEEAPCQPALGQHIPTGFEKQTKTFALGTDAFTWAWKDLILG